MEEVKNKRLTERQNYSKLIFIVAIIYMIFVILVTMLYIYGGIIFQEQILNPISVVTLIGRLFDTIKYKYFEVFSGLIISIIYIIFLIRLINLLIFTIKKTNELKKIKNKEKYEIIEKMTVEISKVFFECILIMVISYLLHRYNLSFGCKMLIIILILFYILKESIFSILDREQLKIKDHIVKDLILDIVGNMIIVFFIILLTMQIIDSNINNLVRNSNIFIYLLKLNNTKIEVDVFYYVYQYCIKDILGILLVFQYLSLVHQLFENENLKYRKIRKIVFGMIIFVYFYILAEVFIGKQIFDGKLHFTVDILIDWIKNSLNTSFSMFVTLLSGFIILYSPLSYNFNGVTRQDED